MTRRGLVLSVLSVAAPICLLAIAWAADRMFHHAGCAPPPSPARAEEAAEADEPEEPEEPTVDVFYLIRSSCAGPESVETCAPDAFDDSFGEELTALNDRAGLERRWLAELAAGDHAAAYGLAWLGSKRALPELRRLLLADRNFYGWETSTPDPNDSVYADNQYHHHQAYITAIEKISGRPLRAAVKLTGAERAQLRHDASGCDDWRAATWLLHKLDGAPLPGTARNRAKRIRCEGAWLPGDPGYVGED